VSFPKTLYISSIDNENDGIRSTVQQFSPQFLAMWKLSTWIHQVDLAIFMQQ
jgi:hypothetical protein